MIMDFRIEIEPKYHEYDPQGIVNNIYVTSYAQHTYLKFISSVLNAEWGFGNVKFLLKENKNVFRNFIPAVPRLLCKLTVKSFRPVGFTVEIKIADYQNEDHVYAVNFSELVHVNLSNFKPVIIEEQILEKLKMYHEQ